MLLTIKCVIMILMFIPLAICSIGLAIVANLFCWLIALFVNKDGNLPFYLRWFQTPDATCYDEMWVAEHPTWSKYKIALTWIARNPAYGFRKWISPNASLFPSVRFNSEVTNSTWSAPVKLSVMLGDIYIADGANGKAGWFLLIDKTGYWNFSYIIDLHNGHCIRGTWGWNFIPIVKGYESVNTAMLETDLIRFYNFGSQGK
jgi:hypothetical protein